MTSIFKEIKLTWNGKEYVIPPDQVMRAIAVVEGVITMVELHEYSRKGTAPLVRLSQAFGAVLRFAGAVSVTDEEIYAGMFESGEMHKRVSNAIDTLLVMMIPPDHLAKTEEGMRGKAKAAGDPQSLRKRTRQPS